MLGTYTILFSVKSFVQMTQYGNWEDIWICCEQILRYPSKVNKTTFASNIVTKKRTGLAREDSGVFINTDKLTQVRTPRHLATSTLSMSQRSLSVFVPAVSLLQLVRPRLLSVSLNELPFHGGFYPVSTPITAIRHR